MRILGIDPGYERLGIAIVEGSRGKETYVHSECFKTLAKENFHERILQLGEKIKKTITEYKPEILGIENLFIEKNQKTAMRVSEVRGAIIFIAKELGLCVLEFTPLQIKDAVSGFGRSDKKQVEQMVKKLIKIPQATKRKVLDDEYDALAIALTASAYSKR